MVYLLDLYLAKIPQHAKDKELFYCKPLQNYTCELDVWYSEQPRGKHFLNDMVKRMCTEAKLQGAVTALRQYERVAGEQQKAACNVLTGALSNDFNAEVKKVNDPKKADERTSTYNSFIC